MMNIIFVVLFKVNSDINFKAVLLKMMFCTIIIHIIAIWVFFNPTASLLIEVTGVDDNKSRIQCVCLSDANGTGTLGILAMKAFSEENNKAANDIGKRNESSKFLKMHHFMIYVMKYH